MNDRQIQLDEEVASVPSKWKTNNNGVGYRFRVDGKVQVVEFTQEVSSDTDGVPVEQDRLQIAENCLRGWQGKFPDGPIVIGHTNWKQYRPK